MLAIGVLAYLLFRVRDNPLSLVKDKELLSSPIEQFGETITHITSLTTKNSCLLVIVNFFWRIKVQSRGIGLKANIIIVQNAVKFEALLINAIKVTKKLN